MHVDEAGHQHHPRGVDLLVEMASITRPHMQDLATADREIRIAQIDMGLSGLVPGDEPFAVSEERCLVVVGHAAPSERKSANFDRGRRRKVVIEDRPWGGERGPPPC